MEIKNNDGNYWIKSKEVEGLFHELSMEMMKNIVRRLKQRGTADLIENPYVWQLEKLNDMHLITEDNVKLISKYSGVAEEVFRDVIANEGFKIYQDSHQQLAQALKSDATPNPLVQDSLTSLAKQTMFEVNNLINTTMPKALQKNYKQTLESAVASVVAGTKSDKKALSEAVLKMYERGFTAFKDRGGKTWTVERYAQTVIRTTTFRVYREMRERSADELGVDTYYYSAKSSARELCAPLQHQIVTKGVARTINGERVLSLPDYGYGSPGGCLGINCGHYLTPFVVGVNYKPELPEYLQHLTEEEAKQNALDKARLKAFDREIRINKDKQILAKELGDKELQNKLKLKEKTFKTGRKSLIEKNPTVIGKYPQKVLTKGDEKVYNKVKKDYKVLDISQIEKLQKNSDTVYNKFTDKELKSLKSYTQGGYQQINDYLVGDEYYQRGEDVKNINSAIKKFKLDKDLITFRGTKAKYFKGVSEGDVISGKVFYSTSLDKDQAMAFYNDIKDYYEEEAKFLEIHVPKGSKALYIGANTNYEVNEKELLLSNKLKYKVKKIDGDQMVLEVHEDDEKEIRRKRIQ